MSPQHAPQGLPAREKAPVAPSSRPRGKHLTSVWNLVPSELSPPSAVRSRCYGGETGLGNVLAPTRLADLAAFLHLAHAGSRTSRLDHSRQNTGHGRTRTR